MMENVDKICLSLTFQFLSDFVLFSAFQPLMTSSHKNRFKSDLKNPPFHVLYIFLILRVVHFSKMIIFGKSAAIFNVSLWFFLRRRSLTNHIPSLSFLNLSPATTLKISFLFKKLKNFRKFYEIL